MRLVKLEANNKGSRLLLSDIGVLGLGLQADLIVL